jgi:hypothetical protein
VHRTGSNVVNGRYYADYDPGRTLGHYSAFRRIDVAALRRRYEETRALAPAQATKGSPLVPGAGVMPLPRFFGATTPVADALAAGAAVATLNSEGYWPARLGSTSHPFKGPGSSTVAPGDFSETQVGDETDTSPYPDDQLVGISTAAYIRNMSVLIRALDAGER